jgi:ribosome recycling factor
MKIGLESLASTIVSDIIDSTKERMQKTISVLKTELGGLRAGRANAQLLDRIMVDYFGTPTPIQQIGNISTPEPRMLLISVWDNKLIPAVEKAIQKSDLGINPSNDGKVIRLLFPELNEERRKELVKIVKKKGEESKIAIRAIRRDANEQIKKDEKDNLITEDDRKFLDDKVQKLTDDLVKEIESILVTKEKEILSV